MCISSWARTPRVRSTLLWVPCLDEKGQCVIEFRQGATPSSKCSGWRRLKPDVERIKRHMPEVTIIKPRSYNRKSTNVRWSVSRYHELFSSSSSVSTVAFREGFGEDLRPGDVSLEGMGEAVASIYDLTVRSSTPRTRLHAIDHTPTLTEPVAGRQQQADESLRT